MNPEVINVGINGSHDWNDISSGDARSVRQYSTILEVFFENYWFSIMTLPLVDQCHFATWWSATELIDELLFIQPNGLINEWSGGITKVAGITANTITKQEYLSGTDISFQNNGTDGNGNRLPGSILKASGGFVNAGFKVNQLLSISGSLSNNSVFVITSVADTVLTIDPAYPTVTEAAGGSVIIQLSGGSSWAAKRFLTTNGGQLSDRAVTIAGQKYTYSGGEGTGTLTGVSPNPTLNTTPITVGAVAYQTVRTHAPSPLSGIKTDRIFCINNQVIIGSTSSRLIQGSTNTSFIDFTTGISNPLRIPGNAFSLTLDSCPTGFAPGPYTNSLTAAVVFFISGGVNDWYRITFFQQTSQDAGGISRVYETTPVLKLPTGTGSAAVSQDAIVHVKNGVAYVSKEPAVNNFLQVTNVVVDAPQNVPMSDPIKDDIEAYDLTGIQGVYINRSLWYTLPNESKIICFDYTNNYWQPPQIISVSRLATIMINGVLTLCGHSANTNETYILFEKGVFNDNGAKFKSVMAFGYENYGNRFGLKNFDELAVEMYMTASTVVHDQISYDYKGSSGVRNFEIDLVKNPTLAISPSGNAGEGQNPEGYPPEGSTTDDIPSVLKVRCVNDTTVLDFFERQRIFWSDSQDCYFAILSYGENVRESENLPNFIHQ